MHEPSERIIQKIVAAARIIVSGINFKVILRANESVTINVIAIKTNDAKNTPECVSNNIIIPP